MRRARSGFCAVLAIGLLAGGARPGIAQRRETVWALRGVTVIDGRGGPPLADGEIVVRGDRIACVGPTGTCALPAEAETMDRPGDFVIPGLWNSHTHLTIPTTYLFLAEGLTAAAADRLRRAVLRIYLASGVTGLVLLIDDPAVTDALRNAERHGELLAPRLFTCGWGISYPGSWNDFGGAATPLTPDEARAAVRAQARDGADCIKITIESGPGPVHSRPRMPPHVASAIVEEAHRLHLPVYAHTTHAIEMRDAIRSGVDVVAHGLTDADPVPADLLGSFEEAKPYYSPTLVLSESLFRFIDEPERLDEPFLRSRLTREMRSALTDSTRRARFLDTVAAITDGAGIDWARANFPHLLAATRRILATRAEPLLGTDPVFYVVPGYDVHRELELLVEAGLTPADAIRAATLDAARALRREADFGTIEPGKYADFVVLQANPLDDVLNTRKIELVVKGGQVYVAGMLLGTVGAGR